MNRLAVIAITGVVSGTLLSTSPVTGRDTGPAVERFRTAYLSGKGLSYVLITTEEGERVYRYGDASRERSRRNAGSFRLFTCLWRHILEIDRISHRVAMTRAKVVHQGEPGFDQLDQRYLAGCNNPYVKSARRSSAEPADPDDASTVIRKAPPQGPAGEAPADRTEPAEGTPQ